MGFKNNFFFFDFGKADSLVLILFFAVGMKVSFSIIRV